MEPVLTARNISKKYGTVVALDSADLELILVKFWELLEIMVQENQL